MFVYRPKAVFFRRPSKFENGRPKDGWTVGWLRPWWGLRGALDTKLHKVSSDERPLTRTFNMIVDS
jgi:hypothetical protein